MKTAHLDTDDAKAIAYGTISEDGLVDLFCALAMLLVGVGWHYDIVAFSAVGPAAMVAMWGMVRRRVSRPRIGAVSLREDTQLCLSRGLKWTLVFGALLFGVLIYLFVVVDDEPNTRLATLVPALPAFIVAIMGAMGAVLLRAARFLVYAAAVLAAGVVIVVTDGEPEWAFFAGAVLPLLIGGVIFVNFLRQNPVIDD